ncbi:MAG: hypothetical protein PHX21_12735 [bacterium]|nr:hypothetical protein [bacterium]
MIPEEKIKQEIERLEELKKKLNSTDMAFLLCLVKINTLRDVVKGSWFFERDPKSEG